MKPKQISFSRRGLLAFAGTSVAMAYVSRGKALATESTPAKLFLTKSGKGRNLMFIHGWACNSNDWIWQFPVFESKYRVVAPDLRGHGSSEVTPSGTYMPENYVADIEYLISRNFPGEKFILIGHSMGGQIAALLASKRPELVEAVVSIDGAFGFSRDFLPVFSKATNDLKDGDVGVVTGALFRNFYDPKTDPALKQWHSRRVLGMPDYVVRESFGPMFLGPNQVGIDKESERLAKLIRVPFYHLCRFQEQADRMRTWFSHPKSKVEMWSNAGHWIMQDRKDDVNTAIVTWIDTL